MISQSNLSQGTRVAQLAGRLRPLGFNVSAQSLARVLRHTGVDGSQMDVDMAVAAFLMQPQPAWLIALLRSDER